MAVGLCGSLDHRNNIRSWLMDKTSYYFHYSDSRYVDEETYYNVIIIMIQRFAGIG